MLFPNETLEQILTGRITVTFRRWKQARVKTGTRLRTSRGVIEIRDVDEVDPGQIAAQDAAAAGFRDLAELREWIEGRPGRLFRIELRPAGPDPRVALRAQADLSDDDLNQLTTRLKRMDAAAEETWTRATLVLIDQHPGTVSTELAALQGQPRERFKRRVRRLKDLGLTVSLEVGYRLSPRGEALLRMTGAAVAGK